MAAEVADTPALVHVGCGEAAPAITVLAGFSQTAITVLTPLHIIAITAMPGIIVKNLIQKVSAFTARPHSTLSLTFLFGFVCCVV